MDINQVMEAVITTAWSRVKDRAYVTRTYGAVARVLGNEARLSQALVHLLINAAETITPGRSLVNSIRITTRQDPQHVVIEIKDTGHGVSDAMMGRVFTSLDTTPGHAEGTSLGLPMCRDIVEEHDGQLEITSRPGGGTCFTIRLPCEVQVRVEPARAPASHAPPHVVLVANDPPAQPRVWVVDDEPSVTRVIGRMLETAYELTFSESPTDVLLRLHAGESFDVMLCDVMMPEMTGVELATRIARDWPGLVQRIVFMSGGALTPTLNAFVTAPGHSFLEKAFTSATLRDAVAKAVAEQCNTGNKSGKCWISSSTEHGHDRPRGE